MSDKLYDVIVVGAGPAGSYTAYKLAASGYSVAVLEQKDAAGLDVCCTGIISAECFSSFDISADVVLGRTGSATFFSPSGKSAKVRSGKALACVVERASFDGAIASKAQCQGVRYFFSHQVTDIVSGKEDIRAEALCQGSREVFSARALVLANGFQPGLPGKLGLGRINSFLIGAQAEIEIEGLEGIEVYFMPQMEAGVFAWMVPTSAGKALVGLLARTEARSSLTEFLLGPFCQGRVATGGVEIRQKAIPLGTLPRSYGERVLVVGDAAGQVKPTTGGGIYLGHLGAGIAAEVLAEALDSGDLSAGRLSRYERQWKGEMGRELSLGRQARKVYDGLSGRQIEKIIGILNSEGMVEYLLNSPDFSFDWHSKLILAGLKYALTLPVRKLRHRSSQGAA